MKKALKEEFGYSNDMQVPRLEKVVVNMGVGEAVADRKRLDGAVNDMTADHRPEAGRHASQEVDRQLQAARRHADRLSRSRCARTACTSSSTAW